MSRFPPASPTTTGVYLGANNGTNPDYSQHPYWRSEMMQKVMNLTTVRTHQYAVWITIGFFEVTRQGDPLMANANPGTSLATLGFDILGPEIGASSGQTTRYRGFFLVDRTSSRLRRSQLTGSFTPGRGLSPDDRIMTLIVVSSQWPEMREREVARVQK